MADLPFTRRRFVGTLFCGGAGAALAGGYMRYLEPGWLEVSLVPLRPAEAPEGSRGLPPGLRILHLSDFHASEAVPFELIEAGIELGLRQEPNLVCLTGDFITRSLPEPDRYRRLLERLTRQGPVFAVLGNHDGGRWARRAGGYPDTSAVRTLLSDSGIRLLDNSRDRVRIGAAELEVAGVGDLWSEELLPESALRRQRPGGGPVVLLSHNPDSKEELADFDWDLMLCGHTHGGQLRVPLAGWTPFAPVRDTRFVAGLHAWEGRRIHITRGVGNLHGMRFNCRPEVALLYS